jgi:hypothetical protein
MDGWIIFNSESVASKLVIVTNFNFDTPLIATNNKTSEPEGTAFLQVPGAMILHCFLYDLQFEL